MPWKTAKSHFGVTVIAFVLCLTMQAFAQDADSSIKPKDFKVVPSSKVKNQVDIFIDLTNFQGGLRLNDVGVVVFFYGQDEKRIDAKLYKFPVLAGGKKHNLPQTHTATKARSLDGTLYWNGTYPLGGAIDTGRKESEIQEKMTSSAGKVSVPLPDSAAADKPPSLSDKSKSSFALVIPTLLSPKANAVFDYYPRKVTLQWKAVPGAVSYTVEWDCFHCCETNKWCSDLGKATGVKSGLTTTSHSIEFSGAQPGRWRVWAVDADGKSSPKSEWRKFTFTK